MASVAELAKKLGEMVEETTIALDFSEEDENAVKLWHGDVECFIVSVDVLKNGAITLTLGRNVYDADEDKTKVELMPSQFKGQIGNLYFSDKGRLADWARSMKIAQKMPATYKTLDVLAELEKPHHIFFIIRSKMQSWGLSIHSVVDFEQTAML